MTKRIVLAVTQREYAAKLADYLREEQPDWDISAFTHESALRRELQESRSIDLLVGQRDLLQSVEEWSAGISKIMVLVMEKSLNVGKWQEIVQYQPLPVLLSGIRDGFEKEAIPIRKGCQVLSVFSASGGTGKTTVALNLVRQAGERGLRTFYLNMEVLNSTSQLFGKGEPDSLSRLLYTLQIHPEEWVSQLDQLCKYQSHLRADYIDAPDHPGERLALTTELLTRLIEGIRETGRYDLVVIDPDSGAGDWHRGLVEISDKVAWITLDDSQVLMKTAKLLRYWEERLSGMISKILFVLNKGHGGGMVNRWELPGGTPAVMLPYIPQWKAVDQIHRLLGVPTFAGAIEIMLDQLKGEGIAPVSRRRKEGAGYGIQRTHVRGAG